MRKMDESQATSLLGASWLESGMKSTLAQRAAKGSLRVYKEYWPSDGVSVDITGTCSRNRSSNAEEVIDFSSNDYLGLARDSAQQALVVSRYQSLLSTNATHTGTSTSASATLGSTGSRLLSGDSHYARQLEHRLAKWHNRPSALLFNSGYDANLAVLSCLPQIDKFLFDEFAHNSLHMGMRLSLSRRSRNHDTTSASTSDKLQEQKERFRHNNVQDLRQKLLNTSKLKVLIVVESVYSMDGDVAPLREMLDLAHKFGALVLVDEAHGIGVFGDDQGSNSRGTGVLTQLHLENHPALACSVHTFGKAAGCHGAVVCGSNTLRQYLWNYAWPLVYSTSLPLHSLVAIECSYESMTSSRGKALRLYTQNLVSFFRTLVQEYIIDRQRQQSNSSNNNDNDNNHQRLLYLLPSMSPIQALVLPQNGNQACTQFCEHVWQKSNQTIRLYPIKSPTVPVGKERIRIILHGHNRKAQVQRLVECMAQSLVAMNLMPPTAKL
ncbi:8-amino-7-oxononanoate synthase [Seminavis robusta]|uniref:8-amino-7-oxononanoate synthase n=1 Tax=Seminavis robusta TaxID=568900 RepID=A0A9N8H1Z7_9STRA|nr:8-amino-7-oxononanoate synthase [Seminavis robusta]|eukprot:Sro53_g031480.1 8-amino-7-oxononanoate synthase (494) ;mRNA; f:98913-100394